MIVTLGDLRPIVADANRSLNWIFIGLSYTFPFQRLDILEDSVKVE